MRSSLRLATLSLIALAVVPAHRTLAAQTGGAAVNGDSAMVHSAAPAFTPALIPTRGTDLGFIVQPSAAAPRAENATTGAPLVGLRSGVHAREDSRALQPTATRANLGQSRAMMVVGVAALIAGAIIGGDPGTIIMVGGAVIGLYGLYQYLQ
jgi:hypothetical protein